MLSSELVHDSTLRPLCQQGFCHFSELFSLPEGKGGGFVAKKYPERIQLVPVQDEYELKDVDTQKDLLILLNRFKYQLM